MLGGEGGITQSFYQPEICPVGVVSSVFISIQTCLRRINKELESFNINKSLLDFFFSSPHLHSADYYDLIM